MEEFENSELKEERSESETSVRQIAIRILSRFERSDTYLEKLIDNELSKVELSDLDKSLLFELVNGVIRWKFKLDYVLVGFYIGDYMKCLNYVKNAMRVALYQIMFLDKIPHYAAINESVEVVKKLQGEKTAGIVNAVLRNIVRNLENIRYPEKSEDLVYYLMVMYSHPRWMVRRWLEIFGEEDTEKLLYRNNMRPYIPLRVNLLKAKPEDVRQSLMDLGLNFYQSPYLDNTFLVKPSKINIFSTELFKNGLVSVQDPSASLAVLLATPLPNQYVIDLCAAPGGKSFYLAELMHDIGTVIAMDKYSSRLKFVEEGAQRLGLNSIKLLTGDATTMDFEKEADIVFADVPCSGTGTISKKPDIKWKREREDIYNLQELQRKILARAVKYVKVGGVLLYSTCSIEPEENFINIEWFLDNYKNFVLEPAENYLPPEVCKDGYMQTFPHIHYIDGAFAGRLKRIG